MERADRLEWPKGPLRVILNEDELHLVQENDILVAATTSPSWTPVFSMIKGVVVDRGASLSHAAIVDANTEYLLS